MKSAFITIVGRPSAGKSTFMNQVCGNKIAIVSPVPQTTRNKIRGIFNNKEKGQLIFLDTPGYNMSEKKFNAYLKEIVIHALEESDIVLYMVDSTRSPGKEEEALVALLKEIKYPLAIALNKADKKPGKEEECREFLHRHFPEKELYSLSGLTGEGTDALMEHLLELAPEGEQYYPEEFYTDQPPEFRISEIIREKIINLTREEVPHAVYVEIADLEMREEENLLWIRAFANVERDSQKGILVGKQGTVIRQIKAQSLEEMKKIFSCAIELDLRVKVRPKWRKKDSIISQLLQ